MSVGRVEGEGGGGCLSPAIGVGISGRMGREVQVVVVGKE